MSKKIPEYEQEEKFGGSRILSTKITGPHTKRTTATTESYKYFKASVSVSDADGHLIDGTKSKAELKTDSLEVAQEKALARARHLASTTI
ncbi:hypothetical protein O4O02_18585 [Pseudomonas fortuita]|uniref:hypothetical protein n=1 Tax=Pseudomonas fortuita TaxID=3233375 RepID=UPI003D817616